MSSVPRASYSRLPRQAVEEKVLKPVKAAEEKKHQALASTPAPAPSVEWVWPAQGKIVSRFIASPASIMSSSNKGIEIQGTLGQAIRSTAAGKVVYSGAGVRGYGNLIIIKHDKNYLSAYAYNQKLLVKEGEDVTAGQIIAEMGKAETGRVLLHFEIRYNGQPVDPMVYLK
jgi:lipoprotein NlpD